MPSLWQLPASFYNFSSFPPLSWLVRDSCSHIPSRSSILSWKLTSLLHPKWIHAILLSQPWALDHIYLFCFGVLYCSSIRLGSCRQDSSWVRSCQLSAFSWPFHIADICCGYQAGSASFLWDSLCEFSLLGTGLFLPSQSLCWTGPVPREATFWSGPGGFCWSWLSHCFFGYSILQNKLSLVWAPLRVFLFSAYRIKNWDLFIDTTWLSKSCWTLCWFIRWPWGPFNTGTLSFCLLHS